MKTIKSITLATLLLAGTSLFAANPINDQVDPDKVAQEIAQLLEDPSFDYEDGTVAEVTLKVCEEGKLQVVSVSTTNKKAKEYIQTRLDSQKLENNLVVGKTYTLPVTFQSLS